MERVAIYIDGGNFHHLVLKRLFIQELDFDFEQFAQFLASGRTVGTFGKRFYVGTVREQVGNLRSKEAMAKQTTLFSLLSAHQWRIMTSKLRTRQEKIFVDNRVVNYQEILKKGIRAVEFQRTREKGIDVKIATDLIVGAVDDQYDTAVVVSSDTDLIPALDWVRHRKQKRIEYIGFSIMDRDEKNQTQPQLAMIRHSDIQRILVVSDLQPFVKSTPKTSSRRGG